MESQDFFVSLQCMKKETYEQQRAFAGEKKASMKRRCVGHDYTRPGIYMLTMVIEGCMHSFRILCNGIENNVRFI